MHDNHLDGLAWFVLEPTVYVLHKLLDPSCHDFLKLIVHSAKCKRLTDISDKLVRQKEERENVRKSATTDPSVLQGAAVDRKKASTEKARLAVQEKAEKRGQKRKISLAAK